MEVIVYKGHSTYDGLDAAIEKEKGRTTKFPITHVLNKVIYNLVGDQLPPEQSGVFNSIVFIATNAESYSESTYRAISDFLSNEVFEPDKLGGNIVAHCSPHTTYINEIKSVFKPYIISKSTLLPTPFYFLKSNAVMFLHIPHTDLFKNSKNK